MMLDVVVMVAPSNGVVAMLDVVGVVVAPRDGVVPSGLDGWNVNPDWSWN